MTRWTIFLFLTAVLSSSVLHGQTDTSYKDGQKIVRQNIASKISYETVYYANGQKRAEGNRRTKNRHQIGEWLYYDQTGKLYRIEKYKKGRLKQFTEWDSTGKKIVRKIKRPLFGYHDRTFPVR